MPDAQPTVIKPKWISTGTFLSKNRPIRTVTAFLAMCLVFTITSPTLAQEQAKGSDTPIPTLLAKRGSLIVDDDGSKDRGGKTTAHFDNGIKIRAGAGSWSRSEQHANVWRSTWKPGTGHIPVASYQGFKTNNLIIEVTFRFGKITEPWHHQCFRIAADQRPDITGHIVSAWANPNNDFIESGFLLQHIRKTPEKRIIEDLLLDHQPLTVVPHVWYTAILEIVDNEALFRMGDHIAYAKADQIRQTKNLVSLTMGTTWHEIKRVRIWHAEPNPTWTATKDEQLRSRKPFTPIVHDYHKMPEAPSKGREPGPLRLTVLHTNDHHGRFWRNQNGEYGMAARKTAIDGIRAEVEAKGGHCLLLSAGDVNTGVPESDRQSAEPDFRGMKLLGYDAMAVGNHEFDNPLETILQQQKWAGFPFLSSNIFYKDGGQLVFPSHADFTFDGRVVRVVGFTTFRTPVVSSKGSSAPVNFKHEIDVASEIIPKLRSECDILIGLSHIGHGNVKRGGDIKMAATVPGFDLIVGGHSETAFRQPIEQDGSYIVQALHWGMYIGRADFILEADKLVLTDYALIPVNLKSHPLQPRFAEDKEVLAFLRTFQEKEKDLLYEPVATAMADIRKPGLLTLICESMRHSVSTEHPSISLMNSGGCRIAVLKKGPILYRDVLMIMPFDNKLCHLDLSGKELIPYLRAGQARRWTFAGVTFEGDDIIVNGQPIQPEKLYTFMTNDFVGGGGDGFPKLTVHASLHYGESDAEGLKQYLKKLKEVR